MLQLFKRLILLLSIAATLGLLPEKAFATHLAGSDISYTCVGGNSYRVDLTFYRDCLGSPAPLGVGIEFRSVSCNQYFTDTLLLVAGSGQEITYPCPGLSTACDDTNSVNPGIQEYHYSGIINFPAFCADWEISWTYCCRNCDITTMVITQPCVQGSNPPMHISTRLDNLNINCNSAPHFTNNPIVFVCVGQSFTYNHGAIDPDGDSLVFSLVDPLIDATTPIPYMPGYSATNPITSSPALTIDPVTGDITMNPTQQEVGVLSVLVQEYRNGVLIGQVVRDMEIYVRPCNNTLPTATGINGTSIRDTTVCPGTQICFDVFSNDADSGQIVTMTWNAGIANSTYTISGFPYPTGNFCWTPGVNDISANPHQFTVTVVDNACPNSGYQTYSFNIYVNSPLVNINVANISCHGLQDGSIDVVPVNPGNGFSYLWSPGGSTSASIANLAAGVYNVTVYDSTTGCSATFSDTIVDPPVLSDSVFALTASCTGANTGEARVVASGGTPGYTYSWSTIPPTANDTATGLAPGTYYVTITDSRGCTTTDSVVINTSSSAIVITLDSVSSLNCFTDTTGIASVSFVGGTPGYTISWNTTPPQTGTTATSLSPGTYIVTITDTVGCSTSLSATVTSPAPIVITGSALNASCNTSDGIAIASVSGGISPYTYSWVGFPGATDDSLVNVPVGVYTVDVTDSNLCVQSQQIVVGSNVISSNAFAIAPAGCTGGANAIAVATASGGTPPYTYDWNTVPPQQNDTAFGLTPGNYQVLITDSNGCTTVDTVNIPNPTNLVVTVNPDQISCTGDSSSIATATVSGGVAPYTYSWSPYGGNGATADSLTTGTYVVTVTDSAGCVQNGNITIASSSTIVITPDSLIQPTCNGASDGSIYISVSGGAGGYTYFWNPAGATSQDITSVDAGIYFVTVTDANGCTQQQQVNLNQPNPVSVYAGVDTAICAGSSIQLQATLQPGSTGVWSSSSITDISDVTDPNATISNVPGGFNTMRWTVTDANGCTGSDDVTIFNYNFTAGTDILQCGLSPVTLNGTIGAGFTGLWTWSTTSISLNDVTLYNATVTFVDYAVDTLTWTVSNPACSSSDQVVVGAFQQPIAEAGDTQTVCIGEVVLNANSPGIGTGMWSVRQPNPSVVADSLDPYTRATGLPKSETTVFVWTVTNAVCSAVDTVAIFFDPACELQLPNGYSPNGDGFNDGYEIRGIEAYPENVFRVFNRWGNEVYRKENYQNTDWIGQNNNGDPLAEGTYFVIVEVKNSNIVKNTYVDLRRFTSK